MEPPAAPRNGGPGQSRADRPYLERPYVWASRLALERIRRAAGGGPDVAYATAVYLALCSLASEQGNVGEVRATITTVGSLVGLRYRKTWQLLQLLDQAAGVIKLLDQPGNHGGQTYQLLSMRSGEPVGIPAAAKSAPAKVSPSPAPAAPVEALAPAKQQGYKPRLVVAADVDWSAIRSATVSEDGQALVVEIAPAAPPADRDRIAGAAERLRKVLNVGDLILA